MLLPIIILANNISSVPILYYDEAYEDLLIKLMYIS